MFDEEVEERFIKNYPEFCCNGKPLSPFWDLWEASAEYGYNKAKEKIRKIFYNGETNEKRLIQISEFLEGE